MDKIEKLGYNTDNGYLCAKYFSGEIPMKLNTKNTVLIGFAFLAISAFWQMYDNLVPPYPHKNFQHQRNHLRRDNGSR